MERAFEREGEKILENVWLSVLVLLTAGKTFESVRLCTGCAQAVRTNEFEINISAWSAEDGDEDDYVPDKDEHEQANPLGFVWRS